LNKSYLPKKTEYRGIVFDSKSEAVFARTLDIAEIEWEYHVQHCGHEWDFFVSNTKCNRGMLIEYKPTVPTMSYVRNLTEMTRANPAESIIVHGNPWTPCHPDDPYKDCCYSAYPIFSSFAKYGWGDFFPIADIGDDSPFSVRHPIGDILGIDGWMATMAMGYRFDLRNGGRARW